MYTLYKACLPLPPMWFCIGNIQVAGVDFHVEFFKSLNLMDVKRNRQSLKSNAQNRVAL